MRARSHSCASSIAFLLSFSPSGTKSESGELVFAPDAICKCDPSLRDPCMTLWDRFSGTRWRFQRRSKAFGWRGDRDGVPIAVPVRSRKVAWGADEQAG